jgi:hypothetical protein
MASECPELALSCCELLVESVRQLSKVLRTKRGFGRWLIAEAVRAKALELCKPVMAAVLLDVASLRLQERLRAEGHK